LLVVILEYNKDVLENELIGYPRVMIGVFTLELKAIFN
jgi:hypothetical protein